MKRFLNVCIACSITLILWLCSSTNCNSIFYSSNNTWTNFDTTLSMMLSFFFKPFSVRYASKLLNASTIVSSLPFLIGLTKIAFIVQSFKKQVCCATVGAYNEPSWNINVCSDIFRIVTCGKTEQMMVFISHLRWVDVCLIFLCVINCCVLWLLGTNSLSGSFHVTFVCSWCVFWQAIFYRLGYKARPHW